MENKTQHKSQSNKRESINALASLAIDNGFGFALWKKPTSGTVSALIGEVEPFNPSHLEDINNGFVFSPYDDSKTGNVIISKLTAHLEESISFDPLSSSGLIEQFHSTSSSEKPQFYKNNTSPTSASNEDDFNHYVQAGIEAIKSGELEKVVPARFKEIDLDKEFDPISTFEQLCAKYPNAFVSVVSIPEIGTWIGATPEALIAIDNNKTFSTVALAGTQKHDENVPLSQVAWTQKEIEEQALVSRYIINCFKKIRLREFVETGPKTIIAGNLMHLKTTYTVDMKATNFPDLGAVMLELLHPTSAVCGMPKNAASDFINQHEGNSREYYSGYLGPVNVQEETSIFVNLRCMQLVNGSAILYSGAGLTEDSIPEKEWLETEMKMNTLLSVIKP